MGAFGFLLVFLGGGVGAMGRYALTGIIGKFTEPNAFPWHTLAVNLIGGLLIGALTEYIALRVSPVEPARLFLVTGVLGGFTTFSAFALENALMWEKGDYLVMGAYIAASVIGTIAAALAGGALMRGVL